MDQKTFEGALTLIRDAKMRNVKPYNFWLSLRAAIPKEYRSDDLKEEIASAERHLERLKGML